MASCNCPCCDPGQDYSRIISESPNTRLLNVHRDIILILTIRKYPSNHFRDKMILFQFVESGI